MVNLKCLSNNTRLCHILKADACINLVNLSRPHQHRPLKSHLHLALSVLKSKSPGLVLAPVNFPIETSQIAGTGVAPTGPAPAAKPKAGLDLNAVPRPTVAGGENTPQGVKYTTKVQAANPVPPPTAITRHFAVDEGNSIPRLFRCSLQYILADGTTFLNTSMFPFGAVTQPFAELSEYEVPIPLSKHGGEDLLRCTRCGAYVNPGFTFLDGGTKIKCNICEGLSPIASQTLLQGGMSSDGAGRPELTLGTYEFLAPAGLAGKKVVGNNILLLIECTQNAISFGLTQQVIASVKASLDYIPDPEHTNIGIITYNNSVQFFTTSTSASGEPTVVFMTDILNPFTPLPKSRVMFNVKNSKAQIEVILDKIAATFDTSGKYRSPLSTTGSCGGAALRSAIELLRDEAGKVLWFVMDIPSVGYGALRSRNQQALYNTDKERTLLVPDEKTTAYNDLSEICAKDKVAIDIFACTQADVDLATMTPVSAPVGGEMYYYSPFNSAEYGEKLHFDIFRNLTRYTVYDVSMKARCSLGLSIHKYLGGFGESLESPIQLSVLDADKTIAFTLKQDAKLKPEVPAYLQFAVLYTTPRGERKIRVLNYTLNVTDQMVQVYSSVDMDAVLALETKQHMQTILKSSISNGRNQLCQTCINVLAHYRKSVSTSSVSAQFVLPESMKVYPLLVLGLMKTPAFGLMEDFKLDAKVANIMQFRHCSFTHLAMRIYPRMYSIGQIIDPSQQWGTFIVNEADQTASTSIYKPVNIPASIEKIVPNDAYLIVNSDFIYVYLPKEVPETLLMELFGKSTLAEIVPEEGLPALETEGSIRIRNVIDHFRKERAGSYQQVKVVSFTSSQANFILKELLVEDCKNPKKEFSYLQFLTHLHRMILSKAQSF